MQVVIARPEQDAARTAQRISAMGHEPLIAPLLSTIATPAAGDSLPHGPWAALVCTSANALTALSVAIPSALLATPLYAVGERTAAAARAAGFRDVRAGPGSAEALAAMLAASLKPGEPVLYLAGCVRKPGLERCLHGLHVPTTVLETYNAHPVNVLPARLAQALRAEKPAAMLHYSRRSAQIALDLAAKAGLSHAFLAWHHHALSADVALPLQRAGAGDVIVAAAPTEDSLLATLRPSG